MTLQYESQRKSCHRRLLVSKTLGALLQACAAEEVQNQRLLVEI